LRQLHEPVGGAAQLEGAAGLQALTFEPDRGAADPRGNQGRMLDRFVDAGGGGDDVFASDGR